VTHGNASLTDYLKSWPLYLLPHRLLSRIVRALARNRFRPWKNLLIHVFIRRFHVDLSEAEEPSAAGYPDFNSFFTRALQPGVRPVTSQPQALACPVDGFVSQAGDLGEDRIVQAKGHDYSLTRLLGGDTRRAAPYCNGRFATLYLSPRDYHRIHMPVAGRLVETVYIPGRLFSVAPHTTRTIPGLFARNERLVCLFDTAAGPMAIVLVGAIFVSCMETVWSGVVNPGLSARIHQQRHDQSGATPVVLDKGAEMGRFNMGSTVILLFGRDRVRWADGLQPGTPVRTGQLLGHIISPAPSPPR
jgi:phosphatidylserine decarboxylase